MSGFETRLMWCTGLSTTIGTGARELIEILKAAGGKMLRIEYGSVDKKPERKIDANGNIIVGIGIEHELLGRGPLHNKIPTAPKHEYATGNVSYIHDSRRASFHQGMDEGNAKQGEEIANGQLALSRKLYPLLRPGYGWMDEFGLIRSDAIFAGGLPTCLFWANIFGPSLVQAIGKGYLLKAPAWKVEELTDGGVLLVVQARFQDWHASPSKEVLTYFQKKLPKIRAYHARPVDLPGEIVRMVQDNGTGTERVVYERPLTKPSGIKKPRKK